jgi:hypothetical protein
MLPRTAEGFLAPQDQPGPPNHAALGMTVGLGWQPGRVAVTSFGMSLWVMIGLSVWLRGTPVLFRLRHWIMAAAVAFPAVAWAQAPTTPVAPPRGGAARNVQIVPPAPVPSDPLELVTSGAHLAQTAEERGAVIALLARAAGLLNVLAQPYDLKTTFAIFHSGAANGNWSMENTYPFPGAYRWTVQGPAHSAVYLSKNNVQYSDQPGGTIPLRLMQVRAAIFFGYPGVTPQTQLRAADARLNGVDLRCALVQQVPPREILPAGRSWDEFEYCVDPKSGLLVTYSPAPGVYVHYDYSKAFHFHKHIIPSAFTVSVDRQTVIEARTKSVSDPRERSWRRFGRRAEDSAQFEPGNLSPLGVGPVMTTPVGMYGQLRVPRDLVSNQGTGDMVIAHGELSPDDQVSDVEILTSTNASLNPYAMDSASRWRRPVAAPDQPGTTPQTREVIFRFTVVPVPSPMRPNEVPGSGLLGLSELPLPTQAVPPLVPLNPVP